MRKVAFALSLSAQALAGCFMSAESLGVRPYEPLTVSTSRSRAVTFEAARRTAAARLAASVEEYPWLYTVVALGPEHDRTRDRVEMTALDDGTLRVDVRTELAGDDGAWRSAEYVCKEYTWSREQQVASEILTAIDRPSSDLARR